MRKPKNTPLSPPPSLTPRGAWMSLSHPAQAINRGVRSVWWGGWVLIQHLAHSLAPSAPLARSPFQPLGNKWTDSVSSTVTSPPTLRWSGPKRPSAWVMSQRFAVWGEPESLVLKRTQGRGGQNGKEERSSKSVSVRQKSGPNPEAIKSNRSVQQANDYCPSGRKEKQISTIRRQHQKHFYWTL